MRDRKTKERDMMLAMLFMFSHDVSSIWHGVLFHRDTLQRVVGVVGRQYTAKPSNFSWYCNNFLIQ